LALRSITEERNELQRQLAAKDALIAAAATTVAVTAPAKTDEKDSNAAALAANPRLAALTSLSTGGSLASSGDAMEVMRAMLKKKSDQNTELVQVTLLILFVEEPMIMYGSALLSLNRSTKVARIKFLC
jgi:hypothetical protein